jgi:aconitate hydratase
MPHNLWNTLREFRYAGRTARYYSLPALAEARLGDIATLPVSLRIVLESVLRNVDGRRVTEDDVRALAAWQPNAERTAEIPFKVARVVLQDFTGVPLLVDLAAMRSAVARMGKEPALVEPLVPVDLVIDHSVQVDVAGTPDALRKNMEMEFARNRERYQFLKWGEQAFNGFRVVPPGIGIVHQVNLEYLAQCVLESDGVAFPDTLVGTDSHTTMINGLGVVAWGVGGIEAEAAMLGLPVYFLTPDVVGVNLTGAIQPGVTATDVVLAVTELLRKVKVVGKFVEFHGEGAASLSLTDRATIANMAPEYGATMGFFPPDAETLEYLAATGRSAEVVERSREYLKAQGLLGIPKAGELRYSEVIDFDLSTVRPAVAGSRRPQDRIVLDDVKTKFEELLGAPDAYARAKDDPARRLAVLPAAPAVPPTGAAAGLRHGDVVIAAITSCTNTSNPAVMLGAGLLAKKAVEKGLSVPRHVKTSLAPGSRVVTEYLNRTGLAPFLDRLGFQTVGYGCTTCIGNSGPLPSDVEKAIAEGDLVVASVLSGNRNFEARVHASVRANFLMSPPLVVAFALAGRIDIDMATEPLGTGSDGRPVYLRDLWPSPEEIREALSAAADPDTYRRLYSDFAAQNPLWQEVPSSAGLLYAWDADSTYIKEPPYFEGFSMTPPAPKPVHGARALAIFGDSVTTDHISPAGSIKPSSPAGRYLQERGVPPEEFNSYGSRRGNDAVMTRGAFANVRIRNLMVPEVEGGVTVHQPSGERMSIYDAAQRYAAEGTPLMVFAGHEYGTGSSRDWAAKGTMLLGVRAVVARSFERIHRSNLVGMGILPLQFPDGVSAASLGLDGTETFDLTGLESGVAPRQAVTLVIHRPDGTTDEVPLTLRVDTAMEVDFYNNGGILPYVLRQLAG